MNSNRFATLLTTAKEQVDAFVSDESFTESFEETEQKLPLETEQAESRIRQESSDVNLPTLVDQSHICRLDEHNSLVCLGLQEQLSLRGRGYLKVLKGIVYIQGNLFDTSQDWIYFGASAWDPLLTVSSTTWEDAEGTSVENLSDFTLLVEDMDDLKNIISGLMNNYSFSFTTANIESWIKELLPLKAVLWLRDWNEDLLQCIDDKLFMADTYGFERLTIAIQLLKHVPNSRVSSFSIWNGWKSFNNYLEENYDKEVFHGKSTAVRSICNRLIKLYGSVWLMDTDLGQSERMPPGMVSLFHLDRPFLSSSLVHETFSSYISYFIGAVSPREKPQIYQESIQLIALEMFFQMNRRNEPCVINTHGWTSGLGLNILEGLFRLTSPTDVITVQLNNAPSKLPIRWFESCKDSSKSHQVREWYLTRYPEDTSSFGGKTNAAERRQLQLVAYFCPHVLSYISTPNSGNQRSIAYQIGNAFAQLPVYQVWKKDVQVLSTDGIINNEDICSLLLGTVVALCSASHDDMDNTSRVCYTSNPFRCVGLGIVKAIENDMDLLYIATPVSESILQNINTLVVSKVIQLPAAAFLWTGPTESSFVSWDGIALGSSEMRSRNNIPRRRFHGRNNT
eukprot:jgi/Galph1/6051/GphlegSOOS_G4764.1